MAGFEAIRLFIYGLILLTLVWIGAVVWAVAGWIRRRRRSRR